MDNCPKLNKIEQHERVGIMPISSSLELLCQKFIITTGGVNYPIFLGAANAKELVQVAMAPSFESTTNNAAIATEVLVPPTKHWQRPLIQDNVLAIKERFDTDGEIMPNPVLLAVNPEQERNVTLQQQTTVSGIETGLWKIKIEISGLDESSKPLWIIDGQHRVKGLSLTERNDPPLPFVLLYSNESVYIPETLARIFAQVTTMARALNPIHHAWMQYVFTLGKYSVNSVDWRAMRTTALLCGKQSFNGKPNLFYDKIQFNPELELMPISPGGFEFDAKYLQELLRDRYFKGAGHIEVMSEEDVAEQISLAIFALKDTVRGEAATSAFFGEGNFQQRYFRDGFIAGVCAYLIGNGKPRSWNELLKDLNFDSTPWDVSTWVNSTGGRAGTISKQLAFSCFEEVFSNGEMPSEVDHICEYLQGKNSYLLIEYKLINDDGELSQRRNPDHQNRFELSGGVEKSTVILPSNARWVRISSPCKNVGPVEISRQGHKFDERYQFPEFKRGRDFDEVEIEKLKESLTLEIKADLYGDNSIKKQLTLKFNG
jgi:hypothetical protein